MRTARCVYVDRPSPNQELYDQVHDPDQVYNRWSSAPAAMQSQLRAFLAPLLTCAGTGCQSLDGRTPPAYQVPPARRFLPLLQAR